MKIQETPLLPSDTPQSLKIALSKWMREVAIVINNDTRDLIVDLATRGLVLKDTQGSPHYWRVTVNTSGVLVVTDLGTSKP
jgi:hypothetical protein